MEAVPDWHGWVDGDLSVPTLEQVAAGDGADCSDKSDKGNVLK